MCVDVCLNVCPELVADDPSTRVPRAAVHEWEGRVPLTLPTTTMPRDASMFLTPALFPFPLLPVSLRREAGDREISASGGGRQKTLPLWQFLAAQSLTH